MKYVKYEPKMVGLEVDVLSSVCKLLQHLYSTSPHEVAHDFFSPTGREHLYLIPTKASHFRSYFDGSIQEKLCKGIMSLDHHPFSLNISSIVSSYVREKSNGLKTSSVFNFLDVKWDYVLFEPSNRFQQVNFYHALKKMDWYNSKRPESDRLKILAVVSADYATNTGLDDLITSDVFVFSDDILNNTQTNLTTVMNLDFGIAMFFDTHPSALQILIEKCARHSGSTWSLAKDSNSIYCPLLENVIHTPDHGEAAIQWNRFIQDFAIHDELNLSQVVELVTASKRDLES